MNVVRRQVIKMKLICISITLYLAFVSSTEEISDNNEYIKSK